MREKAIHSCGRTPHWLAGNAIALEWVALARAITSARNRLKHLLALAGFGIRPRSYRRGKRRCRILVNQQQNPEGNDAHWLKEIGRKGWVILTKDDSMYSNQIEIRGLLESGAPSFVLTGGILTGEQMAATILMALPQIRKLVKNFSPPFIARVTAAGDVKIVYTHSGLIRKIE